MSEYIETVSTEDANAVIDSKLRKVFDGRIVRKDLTKKIKEGANVPVYVLEFLLGQYCSSDDEDVIETGVANVKRILAENYVRPDEAQKILSCVKRVQDRLGYPVGAALIARVLHGSGERRIVRLGLQTLST